MDNTTRKVGRPRSSVEKTFISAKLPSTLVERLEKHAATLGVSRSEALKIAVENLVGE